MKISRLGLVLIIGAGSMWLLTGCKPTILTPTSHELFVRYSAPVEIAVKIRHDSGAEMDVAFERSDLNIPGQWATGAEPVALLPLSVVKEANTLTVLTYALDRAGSWRLRARGVKSGSTWSAWRSFVVADSDQSTAAASLTVTPSQFEGPCPVNVKADGKIGSAVAGKVRYWFRRSDGAETPAFVWEFTQPGTVPVKTNMPDVGKHDYVPTDGWLALVIRALPNGPEVSSPPASYHVVCTTAAAGN